MEGPPREIKVEETTQNFEAMNPFDDNDTEKVAFKVAEGENIKEKLYKDLKKQSTLDKNSSEDSLYNVLI